MQVGTVRSTSFEKAGAGSAVAPIESCDAGADTKLSSFVSEEKVKSDRPDLGTAKVVISGGRGLKNGENFGLLYKVCACVCECVACMAPVGRCLSFPYRPSPLSFVCPTALRHCLLLGF